jgi:hypothetical protein
MEKEDIQVLESLLEEYGLSDILTAMATIIRMKVEARKLDPKVEAAGLHPFPHALAMRETRLKKAMQLQELANRID